MRRTLSYSHGDKQGFTLTLGSCPPRLLITTLAVGPWRRRRSNRNLAEPWTGSLGMKEESATGEVGLYPNPVRRDAEAVTLTGLSPGRVTIYLLDMSGRVVCASEAVVAAGSSQAVFSPPGELTPGLYLLKAEQAKRGKGSAVN